MTTSTEVRPARQRSVRLLPDSQVRIFANGTVRTYRLTAAFVPGEGEQFYLEPLDGTSEAVVVSVGRVGQSCSCYAHAKDGACDHLPAVLRLCELGKV